MASLRIDRSKIVSYRQAVSYLRGRLPAEPYSLKLAAWAGLQDSMPRAAILSLHARVEGVPPEVLDDPSLIQIWGPRFGAYAVAWDDLAIFTLGRRSYDGSRRDRADDTADRILSFLQGRRLPYSDVGRALGLDPNALRYATTTGRVAIRWDGSGKPLIWTLPEPGMTVAEARRELARRYIHVFGPTTPESFAGWAGIRGGEVVFERLADELVPVRTPIGEAWLLEEDESALREHRPTPSVVRLLPSGDAYTLLWGSDRDLLVPDVDRQNLLWTSRVWPGAVLSKGEVVGTWRRSLQKVSVEPWRSLAEDEQSRVEAEAMSFPLPGLTKPISVSFG